MPIFPRFDGNTNLTAEFLREIIREATQGKVTAVSPLESYAGPDGNVAIGLNLAQLRSFLSPESTEEELDQVFEPPMTEEDVERIIARLQSFSWFPAKVTGYNGITYQVTDQEFSFDGTFTDNPAEAQTRDAVEFSGHVGVPIGISVFVFQNPINDDLPFFFCPNLTNQVRITGETPNDAGFYPAMVQRYYQPAKPLSASDPGDPDFDEAQPDLLGSFRDQYDCWLILPDGVVPTEVHGKWLNAVHVGYYSDGLKVYANGDAKDECCTDEITVCVPPLSVVNGVLTTGTAKITVADNQVVIVQDANATKCYDPVLSVEIYVSPATLDADGTLTVRKGVLSLVDGVLTITPTGFDSTSLCCGPVSSSSSATPSGGDPYIGQNVIGGSPNCVLFLNSLGQLAIDPGQFTYDGTTLQATNYNYGDGEPLADANYLYWRDGEIACDHAASSNAYIPFGGLWMPVSAEGLAGSGGIQLIDSTGAFYYPTDEHTPFCSATGLSYYGGSQLIGLDDFLYYMGNVLLADDTYSYWRDGSIASDLADGNVYIPHGIYDSSNSLGTNGQTLVTDGTDVNWADPAGTIDIGSPITSGTINSVLFIGDDGFGNPVVAEDAGNYTYDIITGTLLAPHVAGGQSVQADNLFADFELWVSGQLFDYTGSEGTDGQILSSFDDSGDEKVLWSDPTALGIPQSRASADLTAQTAAVASVCSHTPASDGTFRINAYLTITAVSVDVIQVQVDFTDETSTARNVIFTTTGGVSSLSTTGAFVFPAFDIRAQASAAITIKTVLTTSIGSISYDIGGTIQQLR